MLWLSFFQLLSSLNTLICFSNFFIYWGKKGCNVPSSFHDDYSKKKNNVKKYICIFSQLRGPQGGPGKFLQGHWPL